MKKAPKECYEKDNFTLMREGKIYNPTDKNVFKKHLRALTLTERYNRISVLNILRRNRIIKKLIPDHGKNFFILSNFHCEYGNNISFGDNLFTNFDCILLDVAKIKMGDNCMLGARVTLATPVHPLVAEERRVKQYPNGYYDLEYAKPITLGDDVWIASDVTVCGGVTIGDRAVIGAGSVVTRDIPSDCFAAGCPARVIRKISDEDRLDVWETYIGEQIPKRRSAREEE